MKTGSYLLAALLGGAAASWATWKWLPHAAGASDAAATAAALPMMSAVVAKPDERARAEVERLAREKAEQAAELETLRARLAALDGELARTRENLAELRRPMDADVMSSALRADLKSGEVVVTGGYRLADCTRLYAFVQPFVEQAVDGADVVRISSQFRMLRDDVGAAAGLENLATNAANTLQHGEVWVADEQREILALIDPIAGVSGSSAPEALVRPGASSLIELGEMRLKVTPVLAADRASLDFEVRLEQAQSTAELTPKSGSNQDAGEARIP